MVNYLLQYGDVAEGAWYTEAIRWATSRGIVGGYGNGMFGPNDNITREQLAVMLWRYAGQRLRAGGPAVGCGERHFERLRRWAVRPPGACDTGAGGADAYEFSERRIAF